MARMIPASYAKKNTSPGEQNVFDRLAADPLTSAWTILHSLDLARHTSRVEGEADFVVLVPEVGVLVLEVKSHRSVRRTADGQWLLGHDAPDRRGPFRQASQARHSIRTFLDSKRLDIHDVPIWSAVWFTHVRARATLPSTLEWQDWQVLDSQDLLRGPAQAVVRTLAAARQRLVETVPTFREDKKEPSAQMCSALMNTLRPRLDLAVSTGDLRRARERELVELLDEQYDALDQLEDADRVVFSGPAGSGKSMLALEAARRSAHGGASVRVVCFNQLLARHLDTLSQMDSGVHVSTLHSIMLRESRLNIPPGASAQWWSSELVDAALSAMLDGCEAAEVLVVDEAQDLLSDEYLDVLDLLVRGGLAGGRCLFFGDFERQAIFGRGDGRTFLRQRASDYVSFKLTTNCRNTPRIGEAATFIAGISPGFRRFRRTDDGISPSYVWYEDRAEQDGHLRSAVEGLRANGFSLEDIVVLSPKADSAAARTTDPWLTQQLVDARQPGPAVGRLRYSTVHAFKGLEAPAVVLTDLDQEWGPSFEAVLYIGLTRATDRLVVIATRDSLKERLISEATP